MFCSPVGISSGPRPARCGGTHAACHPRLPAPAPPRGRQASGRLSLTQSGFTGLESRSNNLTVLIWHMGRRVSPAVHTCKGRPLIHNADVGTAPACSVLRRGLGGPLPVLTKFYRQIMMIKTFPRHYPTDVCTHLVQFARHEDHQRRIATALQPPPAAISALLSIGACRWFCRRIVRNPRA